MVPGQGIRPGAVIDAPAREGGDSLRLHERLRTLNDVLEEHSGAIYDSTLRVVGPFETPTPAERLNKAELGGKRAECFVSALDAQLDRLEGLAERLAQVRRGLKGF